MITVERCAIGVHVSTQNVDVVLPKAAEVHCRNNIRCGGMPPSEFSVVDWSRGNHAVEHPAVESHKTAAAGDVLHIYTYVERQALKKNSSLIDR